jgi:hypothetical protein
MIGMALALMLQSAPAPTQQDDSANVDSVTVTAAGKKVALPPWSRQVRAIGWPFLGLGQDKTVLMFAKTGKSPPGAPYQRVWVRHEFRLEQVETLAAPPLTYRSERRAQDVDCEARTFRSLAVYRYPENNLGGEAVPFAFEDKTWVKPEPGTFDETVVDAACMKPAS